MKKKEHKDIKLPEKDIKTKVSFKESLVQIVKKKVKSKK